MLDAHEIENVCEMLSILEENATVIDKNVTAVHVSRDSLGFVLNNVLVSEGV